MRPVSEVEARHERAILGALFPRRPNGNRVLSVLQSEEDLSRIVRLSFNETIAAVSRLVRNGTIQVDSGVTADSPLRFTLTSQGRDALAVSE